MVLLLFDQRGCRESITVGQDGLGLTNNVKPLLRAKCQEVKQKIGAVPIVKNLCVHIKCTIRFAGWIGSLKTELSSELLERGNNGKEV